MSKTLTDEQILDAFSAAGIDLNATTNMLYAVRGQHAQLIKAARALLAAQQPEPRDEVTGWQTIETAPKETELLGWRKDCGVLLIMHTSFDRWASEAECDEIDEETLFQKDWFGTALPGIMDRLEGGEAPTHWMAIPAAPSDAARAGEGHADQA
ncbi:hypothetical protein QZM93_35055 [Burkholderia cepacia]|uniref:hypothetical protein n=1 Tax=Burkholderia cepacia TaxID=292 RepID=UPI00264C0E5A|nr:hypothetical protein [Burkholderia cepacia]MDN7893824.1 hypothetical protein [Burkholderia cepacia]